MLAELATNPYEDRTLERVVDFRHTFSARLEEVSEHGLGHGEAVAIDVALSSALAVELGLLAERDLEIVSTRLPGSASPRTAAGRHCCYFAKRSTVAYGIATAR